MTNRGDVVDEIMGVFSRENLTVPDAIIALSDTLVGMFVTYGLEPRNRDHLVQSLNMFSATCLELYDGLVADGGLDDEEEEQDDGARVVQ